MLFAGFLAVFAALPACAGQSTRSSASYIAPMTGPGATDNATIKVWTPKGNGKFPVFMWIMGTFDHFDNAEPYTSNIYDKFAEYMASKGYIGAIPNYPSSDMCLDVCADTQCTLSLAQAIGIPTGAIGKIGQPEKIRGLKKAIDVLCDLPQADCSLGVAAAGHSQGAYSVVQLATIDSRVTAVNPWSYGYLDINHKDACSCITSSAVDSHIPKTKRRMVVGRADDLNSLNAEDDMKGPQVFSGYTCQGDNAPINCIQSDGSGYYVIAKNEYTAEDTAVLAAAGALDHEAGHPFFNTKDPVGFYARLVPSFATGSKPWHMKPMLDWLAAAARNSSSMPSKAVLV